MTRLGLKNLWAYKRRLLGTGLAVLLGVAFLAGTLVLGDTLRSNFDSLFAQANRGTDAVVRSASGVHTGAGQPATQRGLIDQSLVGRIRAVDGVAAVEPSIQGYGRLVDKHGDGIGGNGPPTLAGNWIGNSDLNPYRLVDGRAPRAADEVVINRGAAKKGDLKLGDTTTVQVPQPVRVRIVGIATFSGADGLGGSTFTAFTLASAEQNIVKRTGEVTSIAVQGNAGASQDQLVQRIRSELPTGVETITGAQLVKENTTDINQTFLDLLRTFLLVFAGVALLVATFSIYNTFSIMVAQRTRESALLRAIGAARGQIVSSVVVEALVVGGAASVAGLFSGVGIAGLLKGMFDAFGFDLPAGGIVFKTSTVVISLLVGTVVTLVASLVPALKAARIPPLAAMRDVAVDRTAGSVTRAVAGVALTGIGVAVVLTAVIGGSGNVLPPAGLGALLTIAGVVVFGPVVARPASAALGAPLSGVRGVTGVLARQNAMRNPRRTSGTAAALMVGVGVVTLFTVFAASLRTSIDDGLSRSFKGDVVVSAGTFGPGGFSPALASAVERLADVEGVAAVGVGAARIDGSSQQLGVTDTATLGRVVDLDVTKGSITRLGDRQIAVSRQTADKKHWHVGTAVPVEFSDSTATRFTIGAIYNTTDIAGDYVISRSAWAPHAGQDIDKSVFVKLKSGMSISTGKAAVKRVAASFGRPDVQDRKQFIDAQSTGVNMLLGIVYVMLALAIVIALMGIANTLSLSIHERTRELGLLRAVGQTRRQLRSMIRWESVVIALFGTIGGLGVGVFLGWALVRAASSAAGGFFSRMSAFSVPPAQLLVVLVVGAIAGVLAGLRPARRAARLDVLGAIATE